MPLRLRWDDGRPKSAKAKEGAGAYDWIPGMFDGAKHTAAHVRDHVCRFIAMKVGEREGRVARNEELLVCGEEVLCRAVPWSSRLACCCELSASARA